MRFRVTSERSSERRWPGGAKSEAPGEWAVEAVVAALRCATLRQGHEVERGRGWGAVRVPSLEGGSPPFSPGSLSQDVGPEPTT
ncbi:hypothetical protein NN561_020202 [Cricetulus griseus]